VRTGIAAADPALLPVGSVIQVYKLGEKYNGIYTIMDTRPRRFKGRQIDVYMWSCNEALALGRREIAINVLRLGWNPAASTPTLIDRLFRMREAPSPSAEAPSSADRDSYAVFTLRNSQLQRKSNSNVPNAKPRVLGVLGVGRWALGKLEVVELVGVVEFASLLTLVLGS
jgi:hypothetical protein